MKLIFPTCLKPWKNRMKLDTEAKPKAVRATVSCCLGHVGGQRGKLVGEDASTVGPEGLDRNLLPGICLRLPPIFQPRIFASVPRKKCYHPGFQNQGSTRADSPADPPVKRWDSQIGKSRFPQDLHPSHFYNWGPRSGIFLFWSWEK